MIGQQTGTHSESRYHVAARSLAQIGATAQILQALQAAGIPVILLKGIALLDRVYPLDRRYMGDVDILIHRQDLAQAEQILQDHGYAFTDSEREFTPTFAREFLAQVPYRQGSVCIELHYHLITMSWYRAVTNLDIDGLWNRAVPVELETVPALRLCVEDEITHHCVHIAVQNSLAYPKGYRDVLGIIRLEDTIDWSALISRSEAWRVRLPCWATLTVIRRLDPEAVPQEILDAFRVPRWRQALLYPLVQRAEHGRPLLVSGRMRFLGLMLVDRMRDLPRLLWQGLFPGRRWIQTRFGLSSRAAQWRQLVYPVEVAWHGLRALLPGGKA